MVTTIAFQSQMSFTVLPVLVASYLGVVGLGMGVVYVVKAVLRAIRGT
jgi:hypothetical protein